MDFFQLQLSSFDIWHSADQNSLSNDLLFVCDWMESYKYRSVHALREDTDLYYDDDDDDNDDDNDDGNNYIIIVIITWDMT